MANANFTYSYLGNTQVIQPVNSFADVAVATKAGRMEAITESYGFPGVDGGGTLSFGVKPFEITWEVQAIAAQIEDLASFELACRRAAKRCARGTLTAENGETWNYVELRSIERMEEPQKSPGRDGSNNPTTRWAIVYRVTFMVMQPEM